jgi:hypothetical protein
VGVQVTTWHEHLVARRMPAAGSRRVCSDSHNSLIFKSSMTDGGTGVQQGSDLCTKMVRHTTHRGCGRRGRLYCAAGGMDFPLSRFLRAATNVSRKYSRRAPVPDTEHIGPLSEQLGRSWIARHEHARNARGRRAACRVSTEHDLQADGIATLDTATLELQEPLESRETDSILSIIAKASEGVDAQPTGVVFDAARCCGAARCHDGGHLELGRAEEGARR